MMKRGTMNIVRIGAIAGLAGALLFSTMWIAAVLADGHWVLGEETLSELGGDRPGRLFFNAGVILEGVLGLLFAIGLWRALPRTLVASSGFIVLLLAGISLVGVGVFPITTGAYHTVASYAFFGLSLVAILLLLVPIWKSETFGPIPGAVTGAAVVISLLFLSFTSVPLAEAVAVICLLIWSLILAIKMLLPRGT